MFLLFGISARKTIRSWHHVPADERYSRRKFAHDDLLVGQDHEFSILTNATYPQFRVGQIHQKRGNES